MRGAIAIGRGARGPGLVVLLALVCALAASATAAGAAGVAPGATETARCVPSIVDGKRVCLKIGQRCTARSQKAYHRAGFTCRRGRLRGATAAQIRGPEPFVVGANGRLDLRTALAAFDIGIADLPGITAKPGEIGRFDDATTVIRTIEANLGALTPPQRAVFRTMTTPGPDALVIPADDPVPAPAPPPSATTSGFGDTAAAAQLPASCGAGTADQQEVATGSIALARRVLRRHGYPLTRAIKVCFLNVNVRIRGRAAAAYVTSADVPPGRSPTCNLFVTKSGQSETARFTILMYAHEYVHCVQHTYVANEDEFARWPEWVVEGAADWLAGMAVEESTITAEGLEWTPWLKHPDVDLFRRIYDAAGFWAMIHQANGQGWERVKDVFTVAGRGSNAAYARALAGLPEVFHDRWGAGHLRTSTYGPEWDLEGPGIPKTDPPEVTISGEGRPHVFSVPARSGTAADLNITASVVTVTVGKGARGLIRTGDATTAKLKTGAFCSRPGGCVCRTGRQLALPKLGKLSAIGFNARSAPASVTIAGRTLVSYCKNPKPGPADVGGGSGGPVACPTPPPTGPGAVTADLRRPRLQQACPTPTGIMVYRPVEGADSLGPPVATFRTASCTTGGSWVAIATDGEYRLEIGITAFGGFGRQYQLTGGGADPTFVIDGPLGEFSNVYPSPLGTVGRGGGGINLVGNGRQFGFAYGPVWGPGGQGGGVLILAGDATCTYPEDA